jgi:hypothetical protein
MARAIPVLRIYDYQKTIEFYINWLGFKIDWEDKPGDTPVYMQLSLGDIVIHLSEHYGDCSPGAKVYIEDFTGLEKYHQQLLDKQYKFMRPGIAPTPWNPNILCMEVIDPFTNKLIFNSNPTSK